MSPEASLPSKNPPPSAPQSSRPVVVHRPRIFQRVAAWAIALFARAACATFRFRWSDPSGFFSRAEPERAIYCLWHNRLALCMAINARVMQRHPYRLAAMVSASKDGAFLAAILEAFGVQPVRGSSSRRGPQALLELQTWAERGCNLALTPDGPRGPRYIAQDGAVLLAQITGLPIVPIGVSIGWKWTLKSWDAFQVPLPFSKCEVVFGEPIRVARELSDEAREAARVRLEECMKRFSRD